MHRTTHTTRPPDTGFTLIEMLVVVSIAAIVLALSFPMISAMKQGASASSGVNSITIAVSAARRYATDPKYRFVKTDIDISNNEPNEPALFSGVAAVFTPAGEVRLTKNEELAQNSTAAINLRYLERLGPRAVDRQGPGQPERELNGFKDIEIDYIQLGSDVGVAGITRDGSVAAADPPLLLPPPFAIWFDQNGYLIATGQDVITGNDNEYQFVYYDGDLDFDYEYVVGRGNVTAPHATPYDPNDFNPNHGEFVRTNYDDTVGKYTFPFDRLEAVIGVYVYSQDAFEAANEVWLRDGDLVAGTDDIATPPWTDTADTDNQDRWDWMKANGEMILFSRQTGMAMRNRDE
jgi:prepilin-type N-terminal cleavage/methylation domain-containing protein